MFNSNKTKATKLYYVENFMSNLNKFDRNNHSKVF